MNLQQIIFFNEIMQTKSINKAAENLFISQPNLSKAIKSLEEELGVTLFTRTTKGVEETQEGKKLSQYATTIMKQLEMIQGLSKEEIHKTLKISSYPLISMEKVLANFYNEKKNLNLSINFEECRLQTVLENVANSTSEIGFIITNQAHEQELKHILKYKNLEYHPMFHDTWFVNIGKNSPLYERETINIRELKAFPVIRKPDDYYSNLSHYLEIDGVKLTEFEKVFFVNETSTILTMLKNTDVFRFGPGISRADFLEHGIRTIPIENCDVLIKMGWIKRTRENISPEAKQFLKFLTKSFSDYI